MKKEQLDLKLVESTQRDIMQIKKAMNNAFTGIQTLDGNMRTSHGMLFQEIINISTRVNFMIKFLKDNFDAEKLEADFKVFEREENDKRNKEIEEVREAIAARAAERAEKEEKKAIIT